MNVTSDPALSLLPHLPAFPPPSQAAPHCQEPPCPPQHRRGPQANPGDHRKEEEREGEQATRRGGDSRGGCARVCGPA